MSVISEMFRTIRRSYVLRFVFFGALAPSAASADLIVLDFEGLSGMIYLTGNPIPESSRVSDQWLSTFGVTFDSGGGYVAVVNLGSVYATSGVNGIGGSTPGNILTYDRSFPIVASFFDPSSPGVPATTDFVSLRIDRLGDSGLSVNPRSVRS